MILKTHTCTATVAVGFLLCVGLPGLPAGAQGSAADSLPVKIAPTDNHIRYVGRFDRRDPAGPRCSWSASGVIVRFTGTALNATLHDSGFNDQFQVVVDGVPTRKIKLDSGSQRYSLFTSSQPGTHTIELVKCVEASQGVIRIEGFELSAKGKLLPTPAPKHFIEIVGDSITCGYGNEASDEKQHFSPATENAYFTYGNLAARALNAEFAGIAWSGRKMWPNNTMDEVYGLALPTDPASTWDFKQKQPDVVLINLGTNDFGPGTPDKSGWIAGYRKFIARVRTNYPNAAIYCTTSPMMWGDGWQIHKGYLDEIVAQEKAAGNKQIRTLLFPTQDRDRDGLGADWHPSVKTHQAMAKQLIATLEADLGWKPAAK